MKKSGARSGTRIHVGLSPQRYKGCPIATKGLLHKMRSLRHCSRLISLTKRVPRSLGVGTIWKFGPLRALLASLHAWFLALVAVLADTKWWSRERNDPPRHAYKARILPIKLQDQSGRHEESRTPKDKTF